MKETKIIKPLESSAPDHFRCQCKRNYQTLLRCIEELPKGSACDLSFDDFLYVRCQMDYEKYLEALRSSVQQSTVFLKRAPNAVRINAYNKQILYLWRGNMDLQFVMSVYGATKYICSYISKPNKGMSQLMKDACKDLKSQPDNASLKQLESLGNQFVRANELTAQEATVLLLRQPLLYSTRTVVYLSLIHI